MSGGSSKSKSRSISTSSTGVWSPQQSFLRDVYGQAQGQFGAGPYEYGPSRVAGMDPRISSALGAAPGQYAAGQRGIGASGAELGRTLSGEYLDPERNTSLQRLREAGARGVTEDYYGAINRLGSQMESAGRTGSGAHALGTQVAGRNLATGLGDMTARLYGENYQQERGRMLGAAGMAPGMAQAGWQNLQGLFGAGGIGQAQTQAEVSDIAARQQYEQDAPAQSLYRYQQMLGGPVMTSTARAETKSKGKQVQAGLF